MYFGVGWCWFVCFVWCCLYAYLLCKEVVVHKTLNHLHIYKIIWNFSLAFREREREPKSFRRHTDTYVIVRTLNIYNQFHQLFQRICGVCMFYCYLLPFVFMHVVYLMTSVRFIRNEIVQDECSCITLFELTTTTNNVSHAKVNKRKS